MSRPVGSYSHWWRVRKRLTVFLYDPQEDDIRAVQELTKKINADNRRKFYGEKR